MSAAAIVTRMGELEDNLTNAKQLAVMVQWIGLARDFVEAVQQCAKNDPVMGEMLRHLNLHVGDPDWTECEGDALRHMHQGIETAIRNIEKKVGLLEGGSP